MILFKLHATARLYSHSSHLVQNAWSTNLPSNLRHLHFDICSIRWCAQLRSAAHSTLGNEWQEQARHEIGAIFSSQMEGILVDIIVPSLQRALQEIQVCLAVLRYEGLLRWAAQGCPFKDYSLGLKSQRAL